MRHAWGKSTSLSNDGTPLVSCEDSSGEEVTTKP